MRALNEGREITLAMAEMFNNELREMELDREAIELAAYTTFGSATRGHRLVAGPRPVQSAPDGPREVHRVPHDDNGRRINGTTALLGIRIDPDLPIAKRFRGQHRQLTIRRAALHFAATLEAVTRRLRADAALNRDRIVDAAAELFAAKGIAVPMDDVARHAGVGVATLYPAFSDPRGLGGGDLRTQSQPVHEAVRSGVGRARSVERLPGAALRAVPAAGQRCRSAGTGSPCRFRQQHHRATLGEALVKLRTLMERAQQAGDLRRDLVPGDVVVMLLAIPGWSRRPAERKRRRAPSPGVDSPR